LPDCAKNTFEILQHIIVGEVKDPVSARSEPLVAAMIMVLSRLEVVTWPIDFDHKPVCVTDEIRDIGAHRHLSAESQSVKAMRLEIAPQQRLRSRH
jgi:hypothetical protein